MKDQVINDLRTEVMDKQERIFSLKQHLKILAHYFITVLGSIGLHFNVQPERLLEKFGESKKGRNGWCYKLLSKEFKIAKEKNEVVIQNGKTENQKKKGLDINEVKTILMENDGK